MGCANMSIKQINGNLTDFEERAIMALALLDSHPRAGKGAFYSGSAIGHIVGGRWTQYRHKVMLHLVALKWVEILEIKQGRAKWFYRFTQAGNVLIEQRIHNAINKGVHFGVGEPSF